MAEWEMRPVSFTVRENSGAIQPTIRTTAHIGAHVIAFYVTAKGYRQMTGRRHPRVTAMRAAYGKRRGQR